MTSGSPYKTNSLFHFHCVINCGLIVVLICLPFNFWSEDQIKDLNTHCFVILNVYLADFLKTNLTKFSVIWVERRQKAGFLSPRSSKIMATKAKERRRRKSERKERRRRKKSKGCTPSFYNSYFGDRFWSKTHCWTQKVHLAITFSKIPARCSSLQKYTKFTFHTLDNCAIKYF